MMSFHLLLFAMDQNFWRVAHVDGSKLIAEAREINVGLALGPVTTSEDGKRILVAVNAKYIYFYNTESLAEERHWLANSARVTHIQFSDDEKYFATSGLDGAIRIFNPDERNYRIENLAAHRSYYSRGVLWVSESSVASVGQQDCAIKFWDVTFT
ncbi:hypothetical protein MXB_3359 [Myxobolus squamalis]|nr:hypothetical protein MXB_3359 [Myxobolus squamalis]